MDVVGAVVRSVVVDLNENAIAAAAAGAVVAAAHQGHYYYRFD